MKLIQSINLKKITTFILSLVVILSLCLPVITPSNSAYADVGGEWTGPGGSTGGGGDKLNKFGWANWSASGSFITNEAAWDMSGQGLTRSVPGVGGAYGDKAFSPSLYAKNYPTYWAAHVGQYSPRLGGKWGYVSQFWDYASNTGAMPDANGNWNMNWSLNSFFIWAEKKNYTNGRFHWVEGVNPAIYNNNCIFMGEHNDYLVSIWLDTKKLWTPVTYTKDSSIVVKFDNPEEPNNPANPGDPGRSFDDTGETPEWKYNNGKTSGTYHGITPPEGTKSHDYSNTIKIKVQVITKKITITCLPSDKPGSFEAAEVIAEQYKNTGEVDSKYKGPNGSKPPTIEYSAGDITDYEKTINYKAEKPENPQDKFRPFNLNKNTNESSDGSAVDANSYARTGDNGLTSDFGNSSNFIKGYVDNEQNITNGSALNAIDINNDSNFTVKFNNASFGLDKYDWFTVPTPFPDGKTWEWSGSNYANGRVGDTTGVSGSVGIYRFNLQLNTSISDSSNGGSNTASLLYNDNNEKISSESRTFYTNNNKENTWRGGKWTARFAKSGTHTTDNDIESTNKKYWVAKYTQARYYEYGVEYRGTFNTSGISEPTQVSPTGSPKASYDSSTITYKTDGKTQRGLYVGVSQTTYYQPILTATWDVKTLAGDTRQ